MILRTGTAHEEGGTRIFGSAVQEFIGDGDGRCVRCAWSTSNLDPNGSA